MANCGCNDYSRTQAAPPRGGGGRQGPARDRARHAAARRHRARRGARSCRARRGLALAVYGAASLGPKAFEEGIAAAAAQAPDRAHPGVDLHLGRRRLAHAARPDERHPHYAAPAARRWRCRPGDGTPFAEDRRCAGTRRSAGSRQLHGEGKVTRAAGHRLRRRQPVALHEPPLLGGRRDQPVRPLGLARALPRPSRRGRQPAPGARARLGPPAVAGGAATCRWRPWREPDNYDFWTPGVWGPRAGQDARRLRRPRRSGARPTPACARRRSAGRGDRPPARPARAVPGRVHDAPAASPTRPAASPPAARARRDDRGRPAAEGGRDRVGRLRHALEPGRSLPGDLQEIGDSLRAFQRDLEARAIAGPRAGARVERVRPPAARRTARAPTTARPARLRDRLAGSRRDGRRVPRPRASSTRTTTCAPPRTSAASTARCSSSGSRWTPAPIIPSAVVVHAPGARRGLMLSSWRWPHARSALTECSWPHRIGSGGGPRPALRRAIARCRRHLEGSGGPPPLPRSRRAAKRRAVARCARIRRAALRRSVAERLAALAPGSPALGRTGRRRPGDPGRSRRRSRASSPWPRASSRSRCRGRSSAPARSGRAAQRRRGPAQPRGQPGGHAHAARALLGARPGPYERRTVTLSPGRYQLWCSLESHEGLGMSVTLRVE